MAGQDEMRQWFLRMLTDGGYSYTEQQLCRWAQEIGLLLGQKGSFCVVISINDEIQQPNGILPYTLMKQCQKLLREMALGGACCICDHMDVVALLPYTGKNRIRRMEQLQQQLSKRIGRNIQLGIGKCYDAYTKIKYSKAEAYEALHALNNNATVADVEDIYKLRSVSSTKTRSDRNAILEYFRRGDMDGMRERLTELAEIVRTDTPVLQDAPYPTSIRRTMVELLVEITHIAADAGVDVDQKLGYVDPYHRIFALQNTPEIIDWVVDSSYILNDAILERRSKMESGMIEKAKRYITENLSDPDLSLTTVSEELGFSPAYFSNFFIKETGEGFKEYVNKCRLELAKQQLLQSQLRIGEVAQRCGFQSESYFIAFFKKHTGVSPGQFRKNR